MIPVSSIYHNQLELRAVTVKLEKLHRWLRMYRDGKIIAKSQQQVVEMLSLISETEKEHKSILNKQ